MAEGILLRSGGGSLSGLTAVSGDVLSNEKFLGAGSDEVQTGSMTNQGTVSQTLAVNGEYEVQPGYYDSISITQNVATQGNLSYNPSPTQFQTADIAGKYMTGDVIVSPISNLKAEYVKKGVTIGDVTGTWEGYI